MSIKTTVADIRRLAETADPEGLRQCVNILCDWLEQKEALAQKRRELIESDQSAIRRMSEAIRGR